MDDDIKVCANTSCECEFTGDGERGKSGALYCSPECAIAEEDVEDVE
jgi:hypothetical protein